MRISSSDYLALMLRVVRGGPESGPIGQLSPSERFNWLVSPRSTVIQTSPVHSGLCTDSETMLEHLLQTDRPGRLTTSVVAVCWVAGACAQLAIHRSRR